MTALPSHAEAGGVEYSFTEITGHPGGSRSGWAPVPVFLDDNLVPNTRYAYTVAVRDALGNVTATSAPVETATELARFHQFRDRFSTPRDFLTQGASGTLWDGFLGRDENSAPEAILAQEGTLRLRSKGTVWDGGKPLGAFLFKRVLGDFVVQVQVVGYAGLANAGRTCPGRRSSGETWLICRCKSVSITPAMAPTAVTSPSRISN